MKKITNIATNVKTKKIVTIGGGTGHFTLLSGLKNYSFNIKAIVSMADHGGSTGQLRDELGVLPPGDIKQCLVALSSSPKVLRDLFLYRFDKGSLKGHSFGNIFLSALEKLTGSFEKAVEETSKILAIKGEVIPATLDKVELVAVLENGRKVFGEEKIDKLKPSKVKIKNVYLDPTGKINKKAKEAIKQAEIIIVGPGDIYTSIIPNFLIKGMRRAILESKAKKILITNLMNKKSQTPNFSVYDHLKTIEGYLAKNIFDIVIYNTEKPNKIILEKYKKEGSFVDFKQPSKKIGTRLIGFNLLSKTMFKQQISDKTERSLVRHDSKKLAEVINSLV